jgi:hypothetical protein
VQSRSTSAARARRCPIQPCSALTEQQPGSAERLVLELTGDHPAWAYEIVVHDRRECRVDGFLLKALRLPGRAGKHVSSSAV